MKKFLSLVLALIMTMSLVTVSAGAAEYKDFTDKDEIQYEEAVAVLNRLGIISGYSEGDFRPEGVLTRGAAAKIIVSLLIGPEAAGNLVVSQAPYTDVPVDHTFAAVISYCKTAGIISGYGDGSFKPGAPLTGYAFSKMLMGALGYKANLEGFVGSGWTMQVAAKAAEAGLFDRISFKGNSAVTREQACQLALNTIKGTMVEYSGGFNVTAGDATVTDAQTRSYKVSNQEFASHINNKKAGGVNGNVPVAGNALYTVEFGEEHFVDLRLDHDGNDLDAFGRPSNVWSYKKVTIGTFPLAPDFTYTTQVINHKGVNVTPAKIERELGLSSYDFKSDNKVNGTIYVNGKDMGDLTDVADIANWTDNGTLVEVYVDEDDADWIRYVVVIQSQLMEVDRIGSDYVALDRVEADGNHDGFNALNIDKNVNNIEEDDEAYAVVKDLKVEDKVVIIPVAEDHDSNSYNVARAYVPETVKGSLTGIERFSDTTEAGSDTVKVTVGGTTYPVSNWNKDLIGITRDSMKITYKDVTLTLDEYGNALQAEDVGETSDFMVVGHYSRGLVNGREVTYVDGWDIAGNEVSLNIGNSASPAATSAEANYKPGDLVRYTNDTSSNTAEWKLETLGVYEVNQGTYPGTNTDKAVRASDQYIKLKDYCNVNDATAFTVEGTKPAGAAYADKGIKFIYVSFNEDDEVESVEIVKGMQNVTFGEVRSYWNASSNQVSVLGSAYYTFDDDPGTTVGYNAAQAAVKVKDDGSIDNSCGIKAVVIKSDSSSVGTRNILYIRNQTNTSVKDEDGKVLNGYTVAMMGDDGTRNVETTIYSHDKLQAGDFARWSKVDDENRDDIYKLHQIDVDRLSTSSVRAYVNGRDNIYGVNKTWLKLNQQADAYGAARADYYGWGRASVAPNIANVNAVVNEQSGDVADTVYTGSAFWVDMADKGSIKSGEDLQKNMKALDKGGKDWGSVRVAMVFNDSTTNDNFRSVAMIVVEKDVVETKVAKDMVDVTIAAMPAGSTLTIGSTTVDEHGTKTVSIEKGQSITGTLSAPTNGWKSALTLGNKGITATVEGTTVTISASATATAGETVTFTDEAIARFALTLAADDDCVKFFDTETGKPTTGETVDKPAAGETVSLVYDIEKADGFSNFDAAGTDAGVTTWIRGDKLYVEIDGDTVAGASDTVTVSGEKAATTIRVYLNGTAKTGVMSTDTVADIDGVSTTDFIMVQEKGETTWAVANPTDTVKADAKYVDGVTTKITFVDQTDVAISSGGTYDITGSLSGGTEGTNCFKVGASDYYLKSTTPVVHIAIKVTTANPDSTTTDKFEAQFNGSSRPSTLADDSSDTLTFASTDAADTTKTLKTKVGTAGHKDEITITLTGAHTN